VPDTLIIVSLGEKVKKIIVSRRHRQPILRLNAPGFPADNIVMRPFLLIFLICVIAMQLEAWPWRTRAQRKQAKEQEATALFETPSLEGALPEAQKEGGETPLSETENPSPDGPVAVKASAEQPVEPSMDQPADKELAAARLPAEETLAVPLPKPGRPIVGKGETGAEKLVSFFLSENKNADRKYIEELVNHYIAEAEAEGINHDIAFAQMCLETGFLRFGGLVSPEMNNFCGLGSTGPGVPGASFSTPQLGIRAHIQHLQAYATDLPLQGELIDPRYHFVRRGSVPEIQGLAGTWAADRQYAEKIESILGRLYRFEE